MISCIWQRTSSPRGNSFYTQTQPYSANFMNPNPSLHLMYFMLNFKPLAARRFSGFYSHSSSLGFLGRNAPPKQKQGLPLLSLSTSPKREPTEPPAVVSARRVGDTAHVSSVSAQLARDGRMGGGRERPSRRARSPAGRETTRQRPDLFGLRPRAAHSGIPFSAPRPPPR